jgi:hypothetical protein
MHNTTYCSQAGSGAQAISNIIERRSPTLSTEHPQCSSPQTDFGQSPLTGSMPTRAIKAIFFTRFHHEKGAH